MRIVQFCSAQGLDAHAALAVSLREVSQRGHGFPSGCSDRQQVQRTQIGYSFDGCEWPSGAPAGAFLHIALAGMALQEFAPPLDEST